MKLGTSSIWPIAALLGAGGCDVSKVLQPDPDVVALAQAAYGELAAGRGEAVLARLPKSLDTPANRDLFVKLYDLIPGGAADKAEIVTSTKYAGTNGHKDSIIIRYRYGARCLVEGAIAERQSSSQPWQLTGFYLYICSQEFDKAPPMFGPVPPPPARAENPATSATPA